MDSESLRLSLRHLADIAEWIQLIAKSTVSHLPDTINLTINCIPAGNSVYYCPQHSCGKVMFSQVSVILFIGGVSASVHAGIHTPLGRYTPRQVHLPLGRYPFTPHDSHYSGWYTSYWNVFLFVIVFILGFLTCDLAINCIHSSILARYLQLIRVFPILYLN